MISAIVVSHGHAAELAESLPALAPQVNEVVVIANVPGSAPADLHGVRVVENERPLGYARSVSRAQTFSSTFRVSGQSAICPPKLRAPAEKTRAPAPVS